MVIQIFYYCLPSFISSALFCFVFFVSGFAFLIVIQYARA